MESVPPPESDHDLLRKRCEAVLSSSWHEGTLTPSGPPFAYTCPSPGHYPWQWYWDSCMHAIAWRRFDSERSLRELSTLLAAQRDDGFIGHTIFWDRPLTGVRRHTYNVLAPDAQMTASIQPPMLAWAWRIAVGDPAAEPAIARQHDWLKANRDLDGDGLLWIVSPDESGLDASPQFDPIWRGRAHSLPGYVLLVRRNRRLGLDARRIEADGGPVCCEVSTNVLYGLSRLSLGQPSLTPALVDRCWDESRGLFLPDARGAGLGRSLRARIPATVAALSPLALPDLPEAIGRRLVEEHLLDPRRFWTPVAPASVSIAEPSFSVHDRAPLGPRRYWRGPAWVNSAWLCWLGLVRLGYEQPAAELARRMVAAVAASGLREYYNPFTRAGMGATGFGWSTLVLELAEPDLAAAATSYLGATRIATGTGAIGTGVTGNGAAASTSAPVHNAAIALDPWRHSEI
ncbi:MAG: MGH1-like glycoside hydrolase domain-containing protein [Solirubrobacteraceae bacterium]